MYLVKLMSPDDLLEVMGEWEGRINILCCLIVNIMRKSVTKYHMVLETKNMLNITQANYLILWAKKPHSFK